MKNVMRICFYLAILVFGFLGKGIACEALSTEGPSPEEWILPYLAHVRDEISLEKALESIMAKKSCMQSRGEIVSPIYSLMPWIQRVLKSKGIHIDGEFFEFLQIELFEREKPKLMETHDIQ